MHAGHYWQLTTVVMSSCTLVGSLRGVRTSILSTFEMVDMSLGVLLCRKYLLNSEQLYFVDLCMEPLCVASQPFRLFFINIA